MSDVQFYRTQMGHRFYEATAPALVRELARLEYRAITPEQAERVRAGNVAWPIEVAS